MSVPTGDNRDPQPSTSSQLPVTCRQFKFPEILLATRNFDESLLIGHGGFGKVYKGTIFNESNPVDAAIKRLDRSSNQGATEFRTEVEILSRLQHCNLVSLFGYCNDEEEMILVFEYIPNRTLEDHLHKLGTPLSWHQRVTICVAAARGVDCLHAGMVIHRDIKSANMLLDDNWAAKISDFGLSRSMNMNLSSTHVSTLVKGTFGYLDPYYFNTGRLSRKSDVYAFGVVLFEVLCRKRAVDTRTTEDQWNLANWVQKSIKKGNLKHIVDLEMRDEISFKSLEAFARIAGRCLHQHPKKRPTMSEVIASLESVLALQEQSNKSSPKQQTTTTLPPRRGMVYKSYQRALGRILATFCISSHGENFDHADSKLSTNSLGNNSSVSMRMDTNEVSEDLGIPSPSLKAFTFADLETVTSNFSLHMPFGRGGFGKVFLGWVEKNTFSPSKEGVGIAVAVKRRYADSSQGHVEWLRDVSLLERLVHGNIVNLLGYCSDEHKYFLVYEYFQNRSFDGFLYGNAPHIADPLSWKTRLSIMIGVARGLVYLHSSKDQVVCGIVKSSDILLDQSFNAKLGDFGLTRFGRKLGETIVSTNVMVPLGYIDQHYYTTGYLSVKTDIYGFGAVLLETLTGLRAWDVTRPLKQRNLVNWASPFLAKRSELKEVMDPRLEQKYPLEAAFKCASLTLRCVAYEPKDRPSSEEVLRSLEQIYADSK